MAKKRWHGWHFFMAPADRSMSDRCYVDGSGSSGAGRADLPHIHHRHDVHLLHDGHVAVGRRGLSGPRLGRPLLRHLFTLRALLCLCQVSRSLRNIYFKPHSRNIPFLIFLHCFLPFFCQVKPFFLKWSNFVNQFFFSNKSYPLSTSPTLRVQLNEVRAILATFLNYLHFQCFEYEIKKSDMRGWNQF